MNYFAYGSNMLHKRLQNRVKSAKPLGAAVLNGYRLNWLKKSDDGSGKCDIVETGMKEDVVYGVLYEFDPYEKSKLDRAEGLGRGYDDKIIEVSLQGRLCRAITYLTPQTDPHLKPYKWYKNFVIAGARQNNLPSDYVAKLEQAEAIEDKDVCRRERNEKLLAL